MNVLLINHYAGSTQHGMEFRPYYLAREWVRMGHNVQIVAASHSHVRTNQPEMGGNDTRDDVIDGIAYRWYATPAYLGNSAARVRNMLSFLFALWLDTKRMMSEFKPDVVIASSTYPMDIWPARRLARLARARLVFEVHDLWPLSPIELGGMPKWHPFILWVRMAEDYAYRHADVVVSMLPKTLDYMISRGLEPDKWHYVPNGIDLEEWALPAALPADVTATLTQIRNRGLPIVGYAGAHGLANALDTLLDAAKLMQGEVSVLLLGSGPERARLLQRTAAERISNVTLLPSIPKASVPSFLAAIDIAYIGLLPEPLFRFGISPNKLMDYMMAGKPVVLSINAGNDPVAEAGAGITVPPANPIAVREAVSKLTKLSVDQRAQVGERGRQFVLAQHAYPALARRFLEAVCHA